MKEWLFGNRRLVAGVLLMVLGTGGLLGLLGYERVFGASNVRVSEGKVSLYVSEDWEVDDVVRALADGGRVQNVRTLERAMRRMGYEKVCAGHYVLRDGMNNRELVDMLRRGLQTPVRVTLNNLRTKADLAASLSRRLMPDSASFMSLLTDSAFLAGYGLTVETAVVPFLPNTYELYWNADAADVFRRMYREYERFWTEERRAKAAAIPLTPIEVSVLASIVEEETNRRAEYPVVAGLYINRLKRGMLLQADPTVKFAVGDFTLRRVLNVHLETDSPYNTYKYAGLPPGPIRMPSAGCIDSVLNYTRHRYLYMVAKETLNGEHSFATNLRDHNNNAIRYRRALNRLRIYH